ncbi:Predicted ATP-binding protein involved in virulence [Anaerovibrio lipolyticus DSM 3074]|uniref:Predicted ATP-binding protein involved in virulence n=1 Tax=Anaerovibrio lipolyticus DSM 3074 TaxID=1120997 RepID=A0A1M6EDL3_9FIRM|nr:Predicted ATP-binding protein involved in virulence [Anaerovibrio lipolyticus DSM 3074]
MEFYIKEMELYNFRKFGGISFALNPRMNVFVGKNASGKTTVLEAATIIAGAYLSSFKKYVPSRFVQNIADKDVYLKNSNVVGGRKDLKQYMVAVPSSHSAKQFPCKVGAKIAWLGESAECQRILEKAGGRTKFYSDNPFRDDVQKWEEAIKRVDSSSQKYIFPIVLYMSSARLWNENRNQQNLEALPSRLDAYQRCLDGKRSSQMAFSYLRLMQNIALEENDGKQFGAYKEIMAAIKYALKDELEKGQYVRFMSRYGELVIENADGTILHFDSLSDGYRNVIKIVVDVAARMCILNPQLGEDVLKQTPGIVIIDELDLSLHPTWQRRIVGILKTLFPKVQFICATHSPFIIQSLDEGELRVLDGDLAEKYTGRSIEDIAEDIMFVDMPQYSEKKKAMLNAAQDYLTALNNADSEEKITELQEKLENLQALYGDNPAYYAVLRMEKMKKEADNNASGR